MRLEVEAEAGLSNTHGDADHQPAISLEEVNHTTLSPTQSGGGKDLSICLPLHSSSHFWGFHTIFMVGTGLEKSWNLTLDWKSHWILCCPGKMAFWLGKSLKIFMYHVKVNLNMKTLMIMWLKVSFCHYIWYQIGETMLSDLHNRATCYIVADRWTTCYIVWIEPC